MSDAPKLSVVEPESLKQLPAEELMRIIVQQQILIQQLQQEIERLKGNQRSDSQTSSKPPSSDLLHKSEKPKDNSAQEAPKRKPGGQPGHPGRTRKGFGRVDRLVILRPEYCPDYGSDRFIEQFLSVQHQQVARLVERPIEMVEYQRQTCQCAQCGQRVSAPHPSDVVPGQDLSIGLQALLTWLDNHGHLSYEKQQEWLLEFGQIKIGVGTLQATNHRVAIAVAQPVKELWQWAKQQSHVHVDQTPWCVKGVKEWLWTVAGTRFCLFHAADTRSRTELEEILGVEFAGVLSSDDYSVYNGYDVCHQQKCLAHLRRHFKKVIRLGHGNDPQLGQEFLDLIDNAFAQHQRWRTTHDAQAYRTWAECFKLKLNQALNHWSGKAGYGAGLLLRSLREKAAQWWYFLDHPEVPPDNNQAERSLRLAVTKRKVCGGSRSMDGFSETADLLSVIQTCRAQGRSVIELFKQAMYATVCIAAPKPSLIPQT